MKTQSGLKFEQIFYSHSKGQTLTTVASIVSILW